MSEMKTLTLNGQTYTLRDSSAARAILCQAQGSAITVGDSAAAPLEGLTLYGRTVQNGTPTPESPVPLESVGAGGSIGVTAAGKNLLRPTLTAPTTKSGITVTPNGDGTFTVNGTATEAAYIIIGKIGPTTHALRVCGCPSGGAYNKYYLYTAKTYEAEYGSGGRANIYAQERDISIAVMSGVTVSGLVFKPMYTLDKTAAYDGYEAYKPVQTLIASTLGGLPGIPVPSGGNYTDESGQQWICDEVDFSRGVYVRRTKKVTFTSGSDWVDATASGAWKPYVAIDGMKPYSACLCNMGSEQYTDGESGKCYCGGNFNMYFTGITTLTELNVLLAETPMEVIVELATPVETPLSAEELAQYAALHSNYPNTTVVNDAGAHMALAYVADTRAYIDNKLAALA